MWLLLANHRVVNGGGRGNSPELKVLTRFIDDGCIELDNNTGERSIRPIALNRKNALFAARTAAPAIGPPSLL